MEQAVRASIRRTLTIAVVIAALGAGWALHGLGGSATHHASAAHRPTKLTASDLLLAAQTATAGIYLQYDGITGPPGTGYINDAKIQSFSFGISRGTATTSGTIVGGTPHLSDISLSHAFDKYSAPLIQQSLTGTGANAVLYFTTPNTRGGLLKYLEIDLNDVVISSYQMSSGGTDPNESLSLAFSSITLIAHVAGSPVQTVSYTLS